MPLSIVIPVHNEAENLDRFLQDFLDGLKAAGIHSVAEILLVENGSHDHTLGVCRNWEERHVGLVRALTAERASYGAAIRHGIMSSTETHVCILECDVLDVGFVAAALHQFATSDAEFLVGSKQHRESMDGRPLQRRLITKAFNFGLRLATGYPGTDTHGLKCIEATLAKQLCELAITSDEVFQTEIVLIAWKLGCRVEEVPLAIREQRTPPVSIRRRAGKALHILQELRFSMRRFPLS